MFVGVRIGLQGCICSYHALHASASRLNSHPTVSGRIPAVTRIAARAHDVDNHLIRKEELSDGSTLFVFGDKVDADAYAVKSKASDPVSIGTDAEAAHSPQKQPPAELNSIEQAPMDDAPAVAPVEEHSEVDTQAAATQKEESAEGGAAAEAAAAPNAKASTDVTATVSTPARDDGFSTAAVSTNAVIPSHEELTEMKVAELRELCRVLGVPRYSKLRKVELITILVEKHLNSSCNGL